MPLSPVVSYAQGGNSLVNNTLTQGEDIAYSIQVLQSAAVPLNVTGCTFKGQITFPTPFLFNSGNNYIITYDGTNGVVNIEIPSSVTAAWPTGTYAYNIMMTSPNGNDAQIQSGSYIILATQVPVL
jgi:hypothetical protein